jgi:hypothetical protein
MTNLELFKSMEATFNEGLAIVRRKNADYAEATDAFKNFRYCELFDVDVPRGILVRVSDKLARVNNLLKREAQVSDEKITDTLIDAINYLAILKAHLDDTFVPPVSSRQSEQE